MGYELSVINSKISSAPSAFINACEETFNKSVEAAAQVAAQNLGRSPIILLSGPSGSGKTTTAKKITNALEQLGITAHNVSLDNYFLTINAETAPKTPEGEIDYESPKCLDMDLLNKHFAQLAAGEEIAIPHFSFQEQERIDGRVVPMKLNHNEMVIFEGIHALNDCITFEHPNAFKIYVSTMTDIVDNGNVIVEGAGLRLVRRLVRDAFFRGAEPEFTLQMWKNVRRGEQLNIIPFKDAADLKIDSALPYEISVMKRFSRGVFDKVDEGTEHFKELDQVMNAFPRFEEIDDAAIPADSILREFIGGSSFTY
ncbi:nucleoside kinase [Oscillospiraceae bacterium CM]|nr:nucleoside kinase [Oscillospiraceae bacterium CM]